jgi:HEAT repeat protein
MLTARWQDELLVLKPADDPEVIARAAELLKRITGERADLASAATATQATVAPNGPGPIEQDVRVHGQAWSASFACVVRQPTAKPDRDTRRTAAQLLADLAPPRCIPDLIELLADEDAEVRRHAATALKRLTGQTLGYSPDRCAAERDPIIVVEWRSWWAQQKLRR